MSLRETGSTKITQLANKLKGLLTTHENKTGSSTQKGHVQAGGAPQRIGTILQAGTDNGYYARADHVHTVDVVDNLTTNDGSKPLSAKQGKWLNDNKAQLSHNHDTSYIKTSTEITTDSPLDLNNNIYKNQGLYNCPLTATAKLMNNTPWGNQSNYAVAFSLIVLKTTTNGVKQIVQPFNTSDNNVYIRGNYNDDWGNWSTATLTPASAIPLNETIAGTVGTSAKYAREDHQHPIYNFTDLKGTDNTEGYIDLIKITINNTYQDKPIVIKTQHRDKIERSIIQIKFANINTSDPALNSITHTGQDMPFHLYKESTSNWILICGKGHNNKYDNVSMKIDNPNHQISITKLGTHRATLPTTNITQSTYIGFTSTEKTKLAGIATNANNYSHPTSYGAKTGVPTGNATLTHGGTFTVTQPVTDTMGHVTALNTRTYTLPTDNNTTYSVATQSANGLLSSTDKKKLDGITESADSVSFTQTKTSGIEIGKININGTSTTLYQQDNNTTYTAESTAANIKMNGTQSAGNSSTYARGNHVHPTDTSRAPTSHASTATTYGVATTGNYGHTKVVQNLTTDDGNGLALGAGQGKALKTAVDGKAPTSHASTATTYGVATTANYGHTKIVQNLTTADGNGLALGAGQGKWLYDNKQNKFDSWCGSIDTTHWYLKPISFEIKGNYTDRPITFRLDSRRPNPIYVTIIFRNEANTDPQLATFETTGGDNACYLYKEATSKWSLIVKKSELYDGLTTNQLVNNNSNITITYPNQSLETLPTSNIQEARRIIHDIHPNLLDGTRTFTGSNYSNEGITSSLSSYTHNGCTVRYFNGGQSQNVGFRWTIPTTQQELGGIYTLSFWARTDSNHSNAIAYFYQGVNVKRLKSNGTLSNSGEGGFGDGGTAFNLTNAWRRYYVTWQMNSSGTLANKTLLIRLTTTSTNAAQNLVVCGVKFEKGPYATEYCESVVDGITNGTIYGDTKITAGSITSTQLASNAVTTAKINKLNVTTDKIADLNVTTEKIAHLSVTTGKIAESAVTSSKIENGTIVNADISESAAISASKIAGFTLAFAAQTGKGVTVKTYTDGLSVYVTFDGTASVSSGSSASPSTTTIVTLSDTAYAPIINTQVPARESAGGHRMKLNSSGTMQYLNDTSGTSFSVKGAFYYPLKSRLP